jgi:exonuclease III
MKKIIVCLLPVLIMSCLAGVYKPEEDVLPSSLKVINWNVWNGFRNPLSDETEKDHKLSYENGTAWIKSQKADVAVFTEFRFFNYFSEKKFLEDTGFKYFTKISQKSYPVAVASTKPIFEQEIRTEGMGHGILIVKTHGVTILGTHLSPGEQAEHIEKRLAEADIIMEYAQDFAEAGDKVIIMGDFNSESAADKNYNDSRNRVVDYIVMEKFFVGNILSDIYEKFNADWLGTYYAPNEPEERFRIDFILTSTNIADNCVSCKIHDTAELRHASDHLPVTAEFKF